MRLAIACAAAIVAVALLFGGSNAFSSAPAQAQINTKPDVGQIYVQIESAKIEALRTLVTAQLLTAQWTHVHACAEVRGSITGRHEVTERLWSAMGCDELLAQLEAAKGAAQ